MSKLSKIIYVALIALYAVVFSPISVFALTVDYTSCSQFPHLGSGFTCDDSSGHAVISVSTGAGANAYDMSDGIIFPDSTYVIDADVTRSAGTIYFSLFGDVSNYYDIWQPVNTTTHFTSAPITVSTSGSDSVNTLLLEGDYSVGFTGEISNICVSDEGGCGSEPPPPPPVDNSADTATSTVNQIQSNLFNGFWVFFATMFFIVWLFRSSKK